MAWEDWNVALSVDTLSLIVGHSSSGGYSEAADCFVERCQRFWEHFPSPSVQNLRAQGGFIAQYRWSEWPLATTTQSAEFSRSQFIVLHPRANAFPVPHLLLKLHVFAPPDAP